MHHRRLTQNHAEGLRDSQRNEMTEEQDPGFPLKPGGNDRRGKSGYEQRGSAGRHGPAAVIPDVFNRESTAFSRQGHMNEGTEEKNTGFPLKPCGNDRGGSGNEQRGSAGRHDPAAVIPDIFNRESKAFSRQCHMNEGTEKKKHWIPAKNLRE